MKVVCIDDTAGSLINPCGFTIKEGEIYTVYRTFIGMITGKPCYALNEDDYKGGYLCTRFIPVSDIDETEFERNYKTEKVI